MTASINAVLGTFGESPPVTSISVGHYTITIYQQLDATVQQQWLALLSTMKAPTLFQHIAWHQAFLTSRYNSAVHGEMLFIIASRASEPVALLPLSYQKKHRYGLPVRTIELLFPTDMGVRDFPVADAADAADVLAAVLNQALPRAGFQWDIVELPDLTAISAAFAAFQNLPSRRKLVVYHHDSNRLKCASERSQCFAHVSKCHVKKTKRKRKGLDALGRVECELITDAAELPQALELFIELEDAGWKGSAGTKTSLHHDLPQKAFYESLIGNSAPALNCCIAVMRLDGKPIAANLCTRTGDTLWMLKITYSDALHDYSPGNLILLYLLEFLAEDNSIDYISFITGGEWTWRWHPEKLPAYECRVFNTTVSGVINGAVSFSINSARNIRNALLKKSAPIASSSVTEE